MKTDTLDFILQHVLRKTHVIFLGVFARDQIPSLNSIKFPSCFVSNTDPCTSPGSHCVAFYLNSPNDIEFFCSYGMHPSVYGFTIPITHYNTTQFQSFDSNVCGHYCIYFLYVRSRSNQALDSMFNHSNHSWNDKQVHLWLKKQILPSIFKSSISSSPPCRNACIQSCTCRNK